MVSTFYLLPYFKKHKTNLICKTIIPKKEFDFKELNTFFMESENKMNF